MPRGRTPIRFASTARPRTVIPQSNSMDSAMMFHQIQQYHKDFMEGIVLIRTAIDNFNSIKQGNPGLPGRPGKDGKNVTAQEVAAEVGKLYKQPKDGESPTAEAIAEVLLKSPKIYRFIMKRLPKAAQDGVSPEIDAVVQETMKRMMSGVMKIEHVAGLDGKFREVYNQLAGKIYGENTWARGGGDTVEAGTGITITQTVNGRKRITAAAASISLITVSGTIDDSNVTFTAASEPSLLNINGSFYKKTGGAFTWSYAAGTITISSPVGTGGSIFGI